MGAHRAPFALVAAGALWVVLCLLGGGAVAHAADGSGRLRIAHLSPDTPAVDVALTPVVSDEPAVDPGPDIAHGLHYGDVGAYRELPPGAYAVSVRPAGSPVDTPPALSTRVDVPASGVRTLALSGSFADLALTPLTDDLTPPGDRTVRVRVVAAAAGAPSLDARLDGGPAVATGLAFPGAGGYVSAAAGPALLRLAGPDGGTTVPLDLRAGTVVSLLVLDGPDGGLTVSTVVDAVAPATVPVGAVEAGGPAAGGALPAVVAASRALGLPLPAAAGVAVLRGAADTTPDAGRGAPAPVRIRVPAAGVDAAVAATGLTAGETLAVPADPAVAGWYAAGPVPGAPGPAVLAGHVDWAGLPGVFAGLSRLAPGDEIVVERADATSTRFSVSSVVHAQKNAFPTAAVYAPVPDAELRLITCGGPFDAAAGSYTENVIVFARAIG